MLRLLMKRTIKEQLKSFVIVTVVVMLLTLVLIYFLVSNIIYEKNSAYSSELMNNIAQTISANMESFNRMMLNIAYSEAIQQYLIEDNALNKYELFQKANVYMMGSNTLKPGIADWVLVGSGGNHINLSADISQAMRNMISEIPEQERKNSKAHDFGIRELAYNGHKSYYLVTAVSIKNLNPESSYGEEIGHLFLLLNPQALSKLEDMSRQTSGTYYLIDRNGRIVSRNNAAAIGDRLENAPQPDVIVHKKTLQETSFQLISHLPKSELYKGLGIVRLACVILFALMLIVMCVLYLIILRNIVSPIRSFVKFIHQLNANRQGTEKKRLYLEGYAEIGMMASKFNHMLDETDHLTGKLLDKTKQIYEMELTKQQAEIAFLNSQINPHFLYNTLESIQGIAAVKGVDEISEMTLALSRIFRYSIKGEETVSLGEELAIIDSYVSIQLIRFDYRFTVTYDISNEAYRCMVIKMILQPIVENAIFHGLELKMDRGYLHIEARVEKANGDLVIVVKDNGEGMSSKQLDSICSRLSLEKTDDGDTGSSSQFQRIGISNVHQRIKLSYGSAYGLYIKSESNVGTEVILRMPGREGEAHA
ncbi:sensor histidine kinase [Paenibacillus sp. J5C_2022]|uniref:cache domain-containing sensor histidine kinase n=1 Tax=Paenibacillus sp. J5C2022 TaxID=2977129 RepID=UPI0021D32786|nr:sensor histidine kinase [Paenibacillus sp. J5C2022]MCU6709932.1 sensor histidine kinase [Paenibacillus sp. J5C2022]